MAKKLSPKMKLFADEYLISLNARDAAIKAGYSAKTATEQGYRVLHSPKVEEYIKERMAEKEKSLIADQDEILRYLTSVVRGESRSEVVVIEGCGLGESQARKIQKAPDEKERTKAAELLGKRYALFNDKVKLDGAIPVVISGEDDMED